MRKGLENPMNGRLRRVAIVQRVLPHYRHNFFLLLHNLCHHHGVELHLYYGYERRGQVPKTLSLAETWAHEVRNRYLFPYRNDICWQECVSELLDYDLVVVEHANALLINYILQFLTRSERRLVGLWGHGRNFQAKSAGFGALLKEYTVTCTDWWFAYTEASAEIVRKSGFALDRITVVQNAIDTDEFESALNEVTEADVASLRAQLGLPIDHVALYCGGMYADKQLDFLLSACLAIRERVCDFHMIVIGNGPEQCKFEQAALKHDWIHYVGPKFGHDRAVYFKASSALLMPGLVGLVIADSFIARTPLFTTDLQIHSPEIAYLKNGENGAMTPFAVNDYADAVAGFFQSEEQRKRLREGCRRSADIYTLENFVERFATGISRCLSASKRTA